MPPDLRGKVALVTGVGAVGQIGHAVAQGLGDAGAKLVLADRNAAGVVERMKELTAQGIDARASAGDLTGPPDAVTAVRMAVREFGGLDVVVNVAGGLINYGPVSDVSPEQLDLEMAINVKTAFFVCQAALPALAARGGGAIVNFASVAVVKPVSQLAAYSAAKAAVAGFTRALAAEVADRNIRVNAVAPATVRTAANVAQMQPGAAAHLVELDELVRAVLFLASDEASAITGQVLPVTGKEL
ncbi:MAG: SDR family oxidoreductase [Gemmatimonadetes bacterium]|nr:SDR family oxidoreductase [Gemmatimonadota bacterium]